MSYLERVDRVRVTELVPIPHLCLGQLPSQYLYVCSGLMMAGVGILSPHHRDRGDGDYGEGERGGAGGWGCW